MLYTLYFNYAVYYSLLPDFVHPVLRKHKIQKLSNDKMLSVGVCCLELDLGHAECSSFQLFISCMVAYKGRFTDRFPYLYLR